jgi:hypothetical protein
MPFRSSSGARVLWLLWFEDNARVFFVLCYGTAIKASQFYETEMRGNLTTALGVAWTWAVTKFYLLLLDARRCPVLAFSVTSSWCCEAPPCLLWDCRRETTLFVSSYASLSCVTFCKLSSLAFVRHRHLSWMSIFLASTLLSYQRKYSL